MNGADLEILCYNNKTDMVGRILFTPYDIS